MLMNDAWGDANEHNPVEVAGFTFLNLSSFSSSLLLSLSLFLSLSSHLMYGPTQCLLVQPSQLLSLTPNFNWHGCLHKLHIASPMQISYQQAFVGVCFCLDGPTLPNSLLRACCCISPRPRGVQRYNAWKKTAIICIVFCGVASARLHSKLRNGTKTNWVSSLRRRGSNPY